MAEEQDDKWKPADFGRRAYYVEDEGGFDNKRLEVILKVGGKQVAALQAREPGMVALVSKPDEEGVWIEIIEPGGIRYTDAQTPKSIQDQTPQTHHFKMIGVEE